MNGTPEQNDFFRDSNAAAASSAGGPASTGSGAPTGNTGSYVPPVDPGYVPPVDPGYAPPYGYTAPPPPGAPNPGLAAMLGFIPGVGAMYNGQFAKGLAHIVIFAILVSLADHVNGIFGLLVSGWLFYMVFDAYQTARARRDGLAAPDPFGLNNIGEKFGVPGNGPNWSDFVAQPVAGRSAATNPYAASATEPAGTPPYAAAPGYDVPFDAAFNPASTAGPNLGAAYTMPPASPYGTTTPTYAPGYAAPYPPAGGPAPFAPGAVPPPYSTPYAATYTPGVAGMAPGMPPFDPANRNGVPTGAIWLIGLGVLALVGSLAHNFYWRGGLFGAFILLGLGTLLIVQRTAASRNAFAPGSAAARWNLLHGNRPGIILLIIGVLQALDGLRLAGWHATWPYLLIAIGLLQVLDRALYNRMLAEPPYIPGVPPAAYGTASDIPVATTTGTTEQEVR